jgi:hypothetical protein
LASSEADLAEQLTSEDKLPEAETLQRDALRLRTKVFGPDDPTIAASLSDLAITARHEGKLQEAETLVRQALAIDLKSHRDEYVAMDENNLGASSVLKNVWQKPKPCFAVRSPSVCRHLARRTPLQH